MVEPTNIPLFVAVFLFPNKWSFSTGNMTTLFALLFLSRRALIHNLHTFPFGQSANPITPYGFRQRSMRYLLLGIYLKAVATVTTVGGSIKLAVVCSHSPRPSVNQQKHWLHCSTVCFPLVKALAQSTGPRTSFCTFLWEQTPKNQTQDYNYCCTQMSDGILFSLTEMDHHLFSWVYMRFELRFKFFSLGMRKFDCCRSDWMLIKWFCWLDDFLFIVQVKSSA